MELVPILSLIVLVATIMTFILSIGAYVYYKMRERKGRTAKAAQPVAIEAELIAPAPLNQRRFGQTGLRTYAEEQYKEEETKQDDKAEEVTRIADRAQVRAQAGNYGTQPTGTGFNNRTTGFTESGRKKFMRYTSDGYIDTDEDKNTSEDKLRWR